MTNFAIITGASQGIGYELAKIMAANKINLLLVARNANALTTIANELTSQHQIQVQTLAKDLSQTNSPKEIYDYCQSQQINITHLINNAGFGDFGMFKDSDWNKQQQMITLNITALTELCHLFLPNMVANKNGKIVNVASTASFQPGPTMSVYYATKAFVLHFSEAIANELQGTGVTVTALCPGATESGFQAAAAMEESKLVKGKKLPTAQEVAQYAFKAMNNGTTVAIHGLKNKILAFSVRLMPRSMVTYVTRKIQDK
jgi:uncharacterized protein